ncbi:MAG: AsmA-like C-terminal region-containing protein, partial [Rhabdaerophilum sp.]
EASGSLNIEGEFKRLQLRSQNAIAKPLKPGSAPISFEDVALEASIARDFSSLVIERVHVRDQGGEAQASVRFSRLNDGLLETAVSGRDLDLLKAVRLWPVFVNPPLRDWVVERAKTGRVLAIDVRTSLAGQVLRDAWAEKPVPAESIAASYRFEGVTLAAIDNAPEIRDARLTGQSTGKQTTMRLEAGVMQALDGKPVSLAGASFSVADTHRRPSTLDMRIPVSGRLDAVLAVLSQPGFKLAMGIPPEIARGEGQVEGEILANLRLVLVPGPSDLKVEAKADIRNVVIPAIVPNERLEAGQFQLNFRANALQLKGDARLNGLPAQIEWRSDGDKPSVATIRATLDEAQRQRRGIDLRPMVAGPVIATVSVTLEKNSPPDIDVNVDLTPARVEGLPPGFSKRAGQASKASFGYEQKGERVLLDDFSLDLGPVALRGKLELGKDGGLLKADFEQFRLSPGDNARASFEKQRNTTRINVRGNSFDLRPFLRGVQSGKIDDAKAPDIDLDVQTTVLVGFSGELISGGEIQAQRRNGALARLAVKGQFGPAPLLVETAEGQTRDSLLLRISSNDGGALLRFLDIYSKAFGGRFSADIRTGRDGQSGLIQMRDFTVRGEPLLQRYAGGSSGSSAPSQMQLQQSIGREAVPFTKMRADFSRRPGRFDIREAVMWGPQVGGTLEGLLDYGQDRVDLKGALVPAYALNNLFAQVPILGPIFGGSQYEGLFALPFVIQGRASAPVLRTNALSVIAPGFLRKLFEVQREGDAGR